MRCFIAVPVPSSVRDRIWADADRLRGEFKNDPAVRIVWVKPESLHITLAFLGETGERDLTLIRSALTTEPLAVSPFAIGFQGLGVFPPRGTVRVIFLEIVAGKPEIVRLEADVRSRLSGLWKSDEKEFSPHVTVGRVKEGTPAVRRKAESYAIGGTFTADKIVLYESRLHPGGPEYIPLETILMAEKEA